MKNDDFSSLYTSCVKRTEVKPMAHLIKNYNFGLPLNNVEDLDNIERQILTDDKYASSLVIGNQSQ